MDTTFLEEIFDLIYETVESDYIIVDKSDDTIILSESREASEGITKNQSVEIRVRPIKLQISEIKEQNNG
jgi:hypothetical protein